MTGETIVGLGAEGGTLTLFGSRDAAGEWKFWLEENETALNYLLDEEDQLPPESLINTSESVSSLPEAFALLDKYRWRCLIPLQVHPEFRLAILCEVQKMGTQEEVASWSLNPLFH
jgi:hypothetical protein